MQAQPVSELLRCRGPQVGFSPALNDAWVAQHACTALEAMADELRRRPLGEASSRNLHLQLCRALLNESFAPANW